MTTLKYEHGETKKTIPFTIMSKIPKNNYNQGCKISVLKKL